MSRCFINSASETDLQVLLSMIRELARFEHLEHTLEVTADSLGAALFGPRPAANALLAWVDGTVAGYAVYFTTFSTFAGRPGIFLDDLYVRPALRRCGIGRALLETVAKACSSLGGRFEWIALRWNEDALSFYRSLGATVMDEWALLRMGGAQVRALARPGTDTPRD